MRLGKNVMGYAGLSYAKGLPDNGPDDSIVMVTGRDSTSTCCSQRSITDHYWECAIGKQLEKDMEMVYVRRR